MKDLKLQELSKLKQMSEVDFKAELKKAWKQLFTFRMKLEVGELKQSHKIKFIRRYIARMNMIASDKGFNI